MRKTSLAAAAVTTSMVLAPIAAFAAWTSAGSGSGTATATTVGPAGKPSIVRSGSSVTISWTRAQLGTGADVSDYQVIRHNGSSIDTVCGQVQYVTGTSCSDPSPVPGSVTYGVVPRVGDNWTGQEVVSDPFTFDTDPPVTTIDPADSSGWTTRSTVSLSAVDSTSSVASISYQVDNTSAKSYTGPFTLSDGMHVVTYHAVDVAGNVETARQAHINVDTIKPTATVDPASGTTNSVTINGADATSGVARVEYQLDPAAGSTTWTTGTTVSWAAGSGPHKLNYRAIDVAGNIGDTATATYTATTVTMPHPAAPVITSCSLGSGNSTTTTITWTETTDPTKFEVHYVGSVSTQTFAGNLRSGSLTAASNNTSGEFWLVAIGPGGTSPASNHYTYGGNGSNRACGPT